METPENLAAAIQRKDLDSFEYYLSHGVEVNTRVKGFTALMLCADADLHYEDRWQRDSKLETIACKMAQRLLEAGATPDATFSAWPAEGWTALHFCIGKLPRVAKVLMRGGADPHFKDVTGASPYDFAKRGQNKTMVQWIEKRFKNPEP